MISKDRRCSSHFSLFIVGLLCILALPLPAPAQAPPLAWVQRFNSAARHVDIPAAITSDNDGNVYVAGSSLGENRYDFVTIKYSSGVPVWTNRYDGSRHWDDKPAAIAVDTSGNVFVTGSTSAQNNAAFATIKYSAAGAPLWTNFGTNISAISMIIDHAGNVIIAGETQQGPTGFVVGDVRVTGETHQAIGSNFLTAYKISADGTALWTNVIPTPTNTYFAVPGPLAVDVNNNAFLTATVMIASNSSNFYYTEGDLIQTAALSSTGTLLWTNLYQGQTGGYDSPVAIAVTSDGNVVLTGNSSSPLGENSIVTLEYSAAGATLWTNRVEGSSIDYERATALTIDNLDNIFVAGYSQTDSGYPDYDHTLSGTLIKYSSTGVQSWINRLTTSFFYSSISADNRGRIFITAGLASFYRYGPPPLTNADFETFEFSTFNFLMSTGAYALPLDTADYGVFITQQPNGNAFVLGASLNSAGEPQLETAALAPNVGLAWTNTYTGIGACDDQASGLAVNTNGDALVTGYSFQNYLGTIYSTLGYSAAGQPLWANTRPATNSSSSPSSSAISDGRGNLIVTGLSPTVSGSSFATIEYSADGQANWTNNLLPPPSTNGATGIGGFITSSLPICADSNGNAYISGSFLSGNFTTVRLSPAGVCLWTNQLTISNYSCSPDAVAAGANGDVFVTGSVYPSRSGSYSTLTVGYSAAGIPLWTDFGPTNTSLGNHAIGVTPNGTVIVAAKIDLGGWNEIQVIAHSTAGVPLWTNTSSINSYTYPVAVATDTAGNAIIAGHSTSQGFTTLKLNSSGVALWTNFSSMSGDQPVAIALDRVGNVYLTGKSYNNAESSYDLVTVACSSAGQSLWTNRYDGPGHGDDIPVAIALNGSDIYVAGTSVGADGSPGYVLLKYSTILQPIPVKMTRLNSGSVLTWTNSLFGLQSSTSASGPFSDISGATSPYTNPIAGPAQFFRLHAP